MFDIHKELYSFYYSFDHISTAERYFTKIFYTMLMSYILYFQCYIHDTNHSVFNGPQTVSRYHLMEQTVSSLYKRPIYSRTGVQFLKIVVLTDKDGNGSNIYLATGEF